MKIPTRTIRNELGQIEEHKGFLGSGIIDDDGREIFEGDVLQTPLWEHPLRVVFEDGYFLVIAPALPQYVLFQPVPLWDFCGDNIKIVGTVKDFPNIPWTEQDLVNLEDDD